MTNIHISILDTFEITLLKTALFSPTYLYNIEISEYFNLVFWWQVAESVSILLIAIVAIAILFPTAALPIIVEGLMSFFWKCTVDLFWQNDISTVPNDLACSDLVQLLWFIVEKILVLFAVVFFLMSLSIWLVWCCPFFWTGIGIPINRWRPWFHRHISFPGEGFIVWHPPCNPSFFNV